MNPLKEFEEYENKGIVNKINPDKNRADALIKEAKKREKFISSIKLNNENANYIIENVYDMIMALIRAKLYAKGLACSGKGAHEAEVAYTKKLKFSENEMKFLNTLRFRRNGILYYGKEHDEEYAEQTLNFAKQIKEKIN